MWVEQAPDVIAIARAVGAHALAWFALGLFATCSATVLGWWLLRRGTSAWRARREDKSTPLWLLSGMALAFVCVATAGVLLFAAIGARLVPGHPMVLADHALAEAIGAHVAPAALRAFAWSTHAGDPWVLWVLGVLVLAALVRRRRITLGLAWVAALLGNALLNPLLKQAFERARPPGEGVFASASGFSFPSGHTSGAMVAYGMLGYIALRTLPERWHAAALVLAAAMIFTTAASRVLLQVHFASDVIAGLVSGGIWLGACIASAQAAMRYRRWQGRRGTTTPG